MNRKIKIDEIGQLIEDERVIITTFMLDRDARMALDWLTQTFKISKQKLFEKVVSEISTKDTLVNIILFEYMAVEKDKGIKKDIYSIPLKQRVRKGDLDKLKKVCKRREIPRDILISNSLTLMYSNLQGVVEKQDQSLKHFENYLKTIDSNLSKAIRYIKKHKHLERRYLDDIQRINLMTNRLIQSIKKDIETRKTIKRKA